MNPSKDECQLTSSQTIGPFPHEAWQWAVDASAAPVSAGLTVTGRLLDGEGVPISDGWIEAWTPAAEALENTSPLPGFRRQPTNELGEFTLQLSRSASPGEPAAYVTLFARGLLKHQFTAVFLADDAWLATAPLLAQVPAERRASLMAQPESPQHYRWDIRLQGDAASETVFFDYG